MECNAKCIWKNLDQLMAVCVQPINFQRVVSYHTLCILSMTKPSFSHFHIKEDCKMRSNYLKLFTIFVNFYGHAFIESEIYLSYFQFLIVFTWVSAILELKLSHNINSSLRTSDDDDPWFLSYFCRISQLTSGAYRLSLNQSQVFGI